MNFPNSPVSPAPTDVPSTAQAVAGEPPVSPTFSSPSSTIPCPEAPRIEDTKTEKGKLELKAEIRGRIEAEAALATQSAANEAQIGELQNGYGFRRVRLGAQGSLTDAVSWVSEVELAGGAVRLRDVFVGLDALPGVNQVRMGHFREPYSLEGMTSSNFMTFLERAPNNVLAPARNWGVCGYWWPENERTLFSVGAFRAGTGSNGQSLGNGDNWAYTARLTGLPIYETGENTFRLVHLGGAFSQRTPPNGILTFTPRTVSNLLTVDDNPGSPFLPIVDIQTNSYQLYNLQAALVLNSFSLQSEWNAAQVQQINSGSVFTQGYYVSASYFLTGEHRSYNRTRGSFDVIEVLRPVLRAGSQVPRGCGALEVIARFSYLDFSSPNLPPDTNGVSVRTNLYEFTTGLNWYLNNNTRIMFNYALAMPDRVDSETTLAHLFGVRTAIYW